MHGLIRIKQPAPNRLLRELGLSWKLPNLGLSKLRLPDLRLPYRWLSRLSGLTKGHGIGVELTRAKLSRLRRLRVIGNPRRQRAILCGSKLSIVHADLTQRNRR